MEISWRGLHGLRVMVRKIGRLNAEQKAKLHELIDPKPVFILSGKAAYETLTEPQKTQLKAAIIEDWHGGMEEALHCLEALEAEGTIKIVPDQEEKEQGNHDRSHFPESGGIHPPDGKRPGRMADGD